MPKATAAERLQRILSLVPLISSEPEITISELAARLGVEEQDVQADLELLPFCGLPPYSPDRLIDIQIVDNSVTVRFAEYFRRPQQLSNEEGFAILAAGRALSTAAGNPVHLESALKKLSEVLGAPEGLSVLIDQPAIVNQLDKARENFERIHIKYYSFGRNEITERDVDPSDVFYVFGQWYLRGYCHLAKDERVFRVDRIQELAGTGEHFSPSEQSSDRELFSATPKMPRVTIDLVPEARWVLESYPAEEINEQKNGKIRATFAIANESRFLRLLLRLGPQATNIKPATWAEKHRVAAQSLLEQYRNDAENSGQSV